MTKKILLSLLTVLVVLGGIAAFSAFEAHVINVTAHIENALRVTPDAPIAFGTVFPQEYFERNLFVTTSESFCQSTQTRVLNIDYKIVQKPKCIDKAGNYYPVDWGTHQCPVLASGEQTQQMPLLCPFLSKTPVYEDDPPYTDYGVPAFHDLSAVATGTINKKHDPLDEWIIDLAVPCYKGYCSQDYDEFVHSYNPSADPHDFEAVGNPSGTTFGCDLWFEVTNIY